MLAPGRMIRPYFRRDVHWSITASPGKPTMNQSLPPSSPTGIQRIIFSVSVGLTWRAFVLRDRIQGRIGKPPLEPVPGVHISRHSIPGGHLPLDAVFVKPAQSPGAALLICHGIGEIVDHWIPAQTLLAANGVASLVFD